MAKQIKFVCTKTDCPNNGTDYIWNDTETQTAQCGGCGTILEAQNV